MGRLGEDAMVRDRDTLQRDLEEARRDIDAVNGELHPVERDSLRHRAEDVMRALGVDPLTARETERGFEFDLTLRLSPRVMHRLSTDTAGAVGWDRFLVQLRAFREGFR